MNRSIGIAAATFSILFLATTGAHAQECGDLDNSGLVVASDALLLLNRAVGLPTQPLICPATGLPATGQTTSYGPGSDGDVQAGAALSYVDNSDGTITDNNTGLMWEKKDESGGIHDWSNQYTWSEASFGSTNIMDGTITTTFLADLNAGGGFAGYTDWRVPNANELQSIVNRDMSTPAVDPAFHQSATCTGCTDVTLATCSCTASTGYWSSSTVATGPDFAWFVDFNFGNVIVVDKSNFRQVRAIRGGF